jgi:hypothetical protein
MNRLASRLVFGDATTVKAGAGTWVLLALCLPLLAWKAWVIWRLNVNWDEFFFLSHVHALVRGTLEIPLQTAYTQLFRWLTWIGDSELPQIYVARLGMLGLLALAVLQIVRLGSRWVSPGAAVIPAIAYLCFETTQRHGASFRADSLLLPVLLGTILLLTRATHSRRTDILAGALCGFGIALTVKTALFAPLLLACVLSAGPRWRVAAIRCLVIGAVTLATATVLIGLHHLTLPVPPVEETGAYAERVLGRAIVDQRVSPGMIYLRGIVREDRFLWIAMGLGGLIALWRRHWQAAAMVLALLPLLFYRNTYPYFYIVMLAPPVVLIAFVVEEVRALARRGANASPRDWVPPACAGLLLVHGTARLPMLSLDEQVGQRQVLGVVHAIFPEPVPYIDHSGMVASFHKVNFFMSTWGMSDYQARGVPFVAPAIRQHRPPMLLITRSFLDARLPESERSLLPEDRELLLKYYQPYWGPVLIAGAGGTLAPGETRVLELPFPGRYRVEAAESLTIDGTLRGPGEVVEVAGTTLQVARAATAVGEPLAVKLVWAEARPAPSEPPKYKYLYLGL